MSQQTQHNEGREPSMRDVSQVLRALREGSTSNPDVLAIDTYNMMRVIARGFPKHMYHATLDPVQANDEQDVKGLKELGYVDHYIPREFPKWIYRRNFHPKFRLEIDPATNLPKMDSLEFIESRIAKTEADLARMMKEPTPWMPQGTPKPGPWVTNVNDIPPIEAGTEEERALEMARLQGQLEEARRPKTEETMPANDYARAEIKRRGRPKKVVEQVLEQ